MKDAYNNDFDELGLPFCDVLLSGLDTSPGSLVPSFDPYRTKYTVVVSQSKVTVVPANNHNASFQFLDENDNALEDADSTLAGHQVEVGTDVTTVNIRIISPRRTRDLNLLH